MPRKVFLLVVVIKRESNTGSTNRGVPEHEMSCLKHSILLDTNYGGSKIKQCILGAGISCNVEKTFLDSTNIMSSSFPGLVIIAQI